MGDPYNVFLKIGYPLGDIFFCFSAMWIFVLLLTENGGFRPFFGFDVSHPKKNTALILHFIQNSFYTFCRQLNSEQNV